MSGALAQLNMPSREEVLSLSQRLTHIEMALDDMGASLEQVRRAAQAQPRRQPQRTAARDTDLDSEPRPAARARNAGSETRATLSAKEA
jgi:hypothetical protein